MACTKTKPIDEIDDVFEIVQVMEAPRTYFVERIKNVERNESSSKTALDQSPNKPNWTAGQVRNLETFSSWTSALLGS